MTRKKDERVTEATQRRYDRIAGIYDYMEGIIERLFYSDWREDVWSQVEGKRILDVGAGTGKNIPYYPESAQVTAIDISERMLNKARRRAQESEKRIEIHQMDAQNMQFKDDSFDSAVATFVFCSVPDAVMGLEEIQRVVRPGGRVVLLEHMRSKIPWLASFMDLLDPVMVRLMGPHINRRTVENLRKTRLEIEHVEELDSLGIFKRIETRVPGVS